MREQTILQALHAIGLTEVEAKVYLVLCTYGKSTISDITKYSGIKRATVYEHIHTLGMRDLIRKTYKGKRVLYMAEDPKKLVVLAKHIQGKVDTVFPELQRLVAISASKPVIRYYEGKESLRALYREMTKTTHTVWSIFCAERYFQIFDDNEGVEFLQNIQEHGGSLRDLVLSTPLGRTYVKEEWGGEIARSKLLPDDFDFVVDLLIVGEQLMLVSFDNLFAVVIHSKEIAEQQLQLFRFVWKHL